MPYISTDEVKAKRDEIKAAFPEYTFSIRCRHHSTIVVTLLEGPIDLMTGDESYDYVQVNPFYIDRDYEDRPEVAKLLLGLKAIASSGQRELVYDSDYGSVPTFYVDINIGDWDRPYEIKVLAEKAIKARKARAKKAMAANEAKAVAKAEAAALVMAEAEEARLVRIEARRVELAAEAEAAEARAAAEARLFTAMTTMIWGNVPAEA